MFGVKIFLFHFLAYFLSVPLKFILSQLTFLILRSGELLPTQSKSFEGWLRMLYMRHTLSFLFITLGTNALTEGPSKLTLELKQKIFRGYRPLWYLVYLNLNLK